MTSSHSAPFQKNPAAAAGAHRHVRAVAPPDRFSLLRLSAVERALGAIVIIALLWAAVYWALH